MLALRLEQESGFFFNMKYFEDQVQGGEWEEVERYLSGFTKVDDNRYSMKIFFEIRKQKYLEALDKYVSFILSGMWQVHTMYIVYSYGKSLVECQQFHIACKL
jgi:hypothetical protein